MEQKGKEKKGTEGSSASSPIQKVEEALEETGKTFAWGWNQESQLGIGVGNAVVKVPRVVNELQRLRVASVAAGLSHSVFLTDNGKVFTCGKGKYGRLGHDTEFDSRYPKLVDFPPQKRIIAIACGSFHTLALTGKKEVWSWGRGDSGQLGLGELLHVLKPTQIVTLSEKVSQIAGGNSHSLFLTEKNSLLTCGNGQNGELGLHPVPSKPIVLPIPIDLKEASGHRIVSIACGPSFSAAIIGTDLYTWGMNENGQLGQGHFENSVFIPTPVEYFRKKQEVLIEVACGTSHSLALNDRGEVFAWVTTPSLPPILLPPPSPSPSLSFPLLPPSSPIILFAKGFDKCAKIFRSPLICSEFAH